MTVLYLTNNPRLAGTARILMSWLKYGAEDETSGVVAVQQTGELADRLRAAGVPVLVSSMAWSRRRLAPLLVEAWRVARWARKRGVSIVHCNEHDVYPFGVLVARMLRRPVVCHVRFAVDRQFCEWAFGGWRAPDALLWTTNQQRDDCAAAVAGVVDERRQHLIRLGPDPSSLGADGMDRPSARRAFDVRDGEIAIGTAAALRPVKRIHDFVDLVVRLAGRHPNVVGLIAGGSVEGDEAYRAEIQRRIAASGLGRRLRWLGHLEPIGPFLASLDVFVSTSEYETFGNSVCEAMACALPVAGYVGGSIHEVIGNAGLVVPNGSLDRLTAAVEGLVTDGQARARLGELGRQRVAAEFNPAVSFDRLRRVYEALAARAS